MAKQARKGRESRPWLGLAESFSTPALCEVGRGKQQGGEWLRLCPSAGRGTGRTVTGASGFTVYHVCFCVLFHSILAVALLLSPF